MRWILLDFQSLSVVAQNIMSTAYKEVEARVGGGLRLSFRQNGTSCVLVKQSYGLQTTQQR